MDYTLNTKAEAPAWTTPLIEEVGLGCEVTTYISAEIDIHSVA